MKLKIQISIKASLLLHALTGPLFGICGVVSNTQYGVQKSKPYWVHKPRRLSLNTHLADHRSSSYLDIDFYSLFQIKRILSIPPPQRGTGSGRFQQINRFISISSLPGPYFITIWNSVTYFYSTAPAHFSPPPHIMRSGEGERSGKEGPDDDQCLPVVMSQAK